MIKLTNTEKQKIKYFSLVIGVTSAVSLLVIVLIVSLVHFLKSPEETQEVMSYDYSNVRISKPLVEKKLLTKNKNSRPATALQEVKGVVVHYTANPGTDAIANRNYFESRKDCADTLQNKVSSHYIIGLDGTIVQCIPETEIAYASNNRNSDTISIECCHPDKSGKFTDATYQSLIHLTAYLCSKYQIDTDDVIRHYDVTGKICPKYFVKHPKQWENFKSDIREYFKKSAQNTDAE